MKRIKKAVESNGWILTPILLMLALGFPAGCQSQSQSQPNAENITETDTFKEYWYAGKAELSHYDLEQIQYGEVRDGDATLIFVTEDFLTEKQVKLESPPEGRSKATVLKVNMLKEFVTGIYKYKVMTSVFTPIDYPEMPRTLKVSSSSQEWCGMTYTQLNLDGNQYDVTGHSYFEQEADYTTSVEAAWLEDELWTKLRLSPDLLPEGKIGIIPGSFSIRASHTEWGVRKAVAEKSSWKGEGFPGENLMAYTLSYEDTGEILKIIYENEIPFRIAGWEQTQATKNGETLTAKSVRTHTIREPYWKQNANSDEPRRSELGLEK